MERISAAARSTLRSDAGSILSVGSKPRSARPRSCCRSPRLGPLRPVPRGAASNHRPMGIFSQRSGRATSAIASTDRVISSEPIRWSLLAMASAVPKISRVHISHTPIRHSAARFQGRFTPYRPFRVIWPRLPSNSGRCSSRAPSIASPIKKLRQKGLPRRSASLRNCPMATSSSRA